MENKSVVYWKEVCISLWGLQGLFGQARTLEHVLNGPDLPVSADPDTSPADEALGILLSYHTVQLNPCPVRKTVVSLPVRGG